MKLRTYTGEEINVLGLVSVTARSDTCTCTLPLLVVDGDGPSLIGRNWQQNSALTGKQSMQSA